MSLSDYIKQLRASKGGLTPWEIADATGVPARNIHLIEVKHRRIGDDEAMLRKLAEFFEVPVEELTRRVDAYRKRLTQFLEESRKSEASIAVKLESGEELVGKVKWYSREALSLAETEGEDCIIQRSWVADWRRQDNPGWEVATPA